MNKAVEHLERDLDEQCETVETFPCAPGLVCSVARGVGLNPSTGPMFSLKVDTHQETADETLEAAIRENPGWYWPRGKACPCMNLARDIDCNIDHREQALVAGERFRQERRRNAAV